jgi:hypothetical protein
MQHDAIIMIQYHTWYSNVIRRSSRRDEGRPKSTASSFSNRAKNNESVATSKNYK